MGNFQQKINNITQSLSPPITKSADIPVDAGTFHSNTSIKKAVLEYESGYFKSISEDSSIGCKTSDDEYTTYDTKTEKSEKELNDTTRDLGLPKDGLASVLREKGNSAKGTKTSVYRHGEQNF